MKIELINNILTRYMPTPEGIKSIAREYARCTCIGTFDAQQREEDEKVEYDFALPVLEWLAERYCLVEKSEVLNEYADAVAEGKHAHLKHQIQSRTRVRELERVFGKEMFEER